MEVLLLAVMAASNVLCFMVGAKVGQKVVKGEAVELPNPAKAVREHKKRIEAEEEQSRINTILENIDRYDGTGVGQKEVPRR